MLFKNLFKKFFKASSLMKSLETKDDCEDLSLFYLRSRNGFSDAKDYVSNIESPSFVALQVISIPGSPYASILLDRAILVLTSLSTEEARRHYKDFRFPRASDGESFMRSIEAFINLIGWNDHWPPLEHQKALLYRAWKALSEERKVNFCRPIDELDGKSRILSFGDPGLFPFTFSELKKQFELEKRWFIADRYLMFTFAAQRAESVCYYTVLTITGNDLFVLNCFESDKEVMVHRDMLNDIFGNLTPDDFKKISDYMVHYGRKFQFRDAEKEYLTDHIENVFDMARDDLSMNRTIKGDESVIKEFRKLQKESSWEPIIG